MIELFHQAYDSLAPGGPVMAVLFLCSLFCVALIFERVLSLRRNKILPQRFVDEILSLSREKKVSEIQTLARTNESSFARILSVALQTLGRSKEKADEAIEMKGRREVSELEKNLDLLGVLAAIGPLLGLLGTVTGMIKTFSVVRLTGVGDPLKLSGGISEALLNTAGGLMVGIPALVFQRYFLRKVDRMILDMEELTQEVLHSIRGD